MKNRTKIELAAFVLVAAVFLMSQIRNVITPSPSPVPELTAEAVLQAAAETSAAGMQETSVQSVEQSTESFTKPASEAEPGMHGAVTEPAEAIESGASPDEEEAASPQDSSGAGTAAVTESAAAVLTLSETLAEPVPAADSLPEDGAYTDKDSVALYIHTYGHLPSNFITKEKAKEAGWDAQAGNLDKVCPGMSIGGDYFGNYEGLLPKKKGRKYYECDIDYHSKKGRRGAKRIVFSNDGLIYYTEDHYQSFELLYGDEG